MAYNKSDLVSKIAQKSNLTKAQAEAAVNAFQDVFVEAMKSGEGLKLTGLFSAERVKRAARTGRNPRTGDNEIARTPTIVVGVLCVLRRRLGGYLNLHRLIRTIRKHSHQLCEFFGRLGFEWVEKHGFAAFGSRHG